MNDDLNHIGDFDEYLRQSEPHKRERAESWKTAIGLQEVDGLKPSSYLLDTARQHIEGDITIDEVKDLIDSYYQVQTGKTENIRETEEADKASRFEIQRQVIHGNHITAVLLYNVLKLDIDHDGSSSCVLVLNRRCLGQGWSWSVAGKVR